MALIDELRVRLEPVIEAWLREKLAPYEQENLALRTRATELRAELAGIQAALRAEKCG